MVVESGVVVWGSTTGDPAALEPGPEVVVQGREPVGPFDEREPFDRRRPLGDVGRTAARDLLGVRFVDDALSDVVDRRRSRICRRMRRRR